MTYLDLDRFRGVAHRDLERDLVDAVVGVPLLGAGVAGEEEQVAAIDLTARGIWADSSHLSDGGSLPPRG